LLGDCVGFAAVTAATANVAAGVTLVKKLASLPPARVGSSWDGTLGGIPLGAVGCDASSVIQASRLEIWDSKSGRPADWVGTAPKTWLIELPAPGGSVMAGVGPVSISEIWLSRSGISAV
jgi:hypothetical protein